MVPWRARLDKKATSISPLVALGVRADGQKVPLAVKNMGGESGAAWRCLLDDLVKRGLQTPEPVIADGAPDLPREETSADYNDMTYAETRAEIEVGREAPLRKWRLKRPAGATSLGAGDKLSTFTLFPQGHGNRLGPRTLLRGRVRNSSGGSRRGTVLPSAETAAMVFWAPLASGQIMTRKVDGWQNPNEKPFREMIDLAA